MAPRVLILAIVSPAEGLKPDPDAVWTRGTATVIPDDVHDLPALAACLSSVFTIPIGSTFSILGKFDEEDSAPLWLPFEGALPEAECLYVRVVPPSADSSVALGSILQKLDALESILQRLVSKRRKIYGTISEDIDGNITEDEGILELEAMLGGTISEGIDGNIIEDEGILEAMLGDERVWDERYEEQQRERYCKVVEGWLEDRKKNPRIKWVNGNREHIRHKFEHFAMSSRKDMMIAMSRTFGGLFAQGALLGVETKRKRLTKKSLRQAMVDFSLWSDASCFPFVQLITDMQKGGVAFYCKAVDASARRGIEMGRVILKNMEEVKEFVSRMGAAFPDDLGRDTPDGLIIPATLDCPPRKKFKPIDKGSSSGEERANKGDGAAFPDDLGDGLNIPETLAYPLRKKFTSIGSSSKQQTGEERATKGQIALWTIGARFLENEGDVANLADVMDLDSFQQQLGEV